MRVRKSTIEQRRTEINKQLTCLRSQLARKSQKDFTTDFRFRSWLEGTNELITWLLEELSALDDPGEYDELPAAVVADELGLQLYEIKLLIRMGEVEVTGRRAHPRVCRAELERLAQLGRGMHLALANQDAEHIFKDAIARLKAGDITAAQRDYSRIKARETCIGDYALALEIALGLAEGRYVDARRVVNFILSARLGQRDAICSNLAQALLGVHFKSDEVKGEALRLLKLLGVYPSGAAAEHNVAEGGIELTALYIMAAAREAVRELITVHVPPQHLNEFNRRLGNAIFNTLHAQVYAGTSVRSLSYLTELEHRVPHFWEPLQLSEDLREE